MKNIKTSLIALFLLAASMGFSQSVGRRVKQRAKDDAGYKVDQKVDKAVDKVDNVISGLFKKRDKGKRQKRDRKADRNSAVQQKAVVNATGAATITATSSFSDFKPGENILFQDDFSQDALADFPAKWNSTGSGSVTTLNGAAGRWLKLADNTLVTPAMDKALPDNCTIGFDLFLNAPEGAIVPFIQFGFSDSKNILTQDVYRSQRFWVSLDNYDAKNLYVVNYGLNNLSPIGNKQSFPLANYANAILHVSIAINKTRVRVYLDQTKIVDLPRVLTSAMLHSFYIANYPKIPTSTAGLFIGNVRIATAGVDARSLLVKQLMEEGSVSTSDILFDVNSAVIQPSSYSVINQIGEALNSNPTLKIKVVGHTDNDGDAASNLSLSKRRAISVKTYLMDKYNIDSYRIQTDGKGETNPVADNNTAAGKAKNRRVEFIKL